MKKAFITGGSRGIGRAIADEFRKNSYEVFAPSRSELDLEDKASVDSFIKEHSAERFDTIVNNAGINEISLLENLPDLELGRMMMVNLVQPIRLLRGMIPQMKSIGKGRIINIASIWAVVSKEGRAVYSATKNAMHGITNTLALELAPSGILVNTVCPGFTLTELTRKNNTEKEIGDIAKDIPLRRMADPSEIACLVFFLGSESNTYITGQKICIDGGYTIK
jgi:3-oxoacyl-[acyl-carrier protein] reductase